MRVMRLSMVEVRLLHGAIFLLEILSLRIGRTSTWILLAICMILINDLQYEDYL
jgi:hypothetical protein